MSESGMPRKDIIRCAECKKYKTMWCAMDIWTNEITIYKAKPDDYCSRWEKKE